MCANACPCASSFFSGWRCKFEAGKLVRNTLKQSPQRLPFRQPRGLWGRLKRLARLRLIAPMMRSHHTPEFSARAALVGLGWAFTPSVGFQMPLVLGTWLIARRVFKWDFSLPQSLAWTWATNAFTALPCYYVFFLTGQVILGRWSNLNGYDTFVAIFHAAFADDLTLLAATRAISKVLVLDWGVAMWVGSVPWAAMIGSLGYRLTLRFVLAYRQARARRIEKRRARRTENGLARQGGSGG
jgi:uncharacterized protein (DUF2062 family)